MFRGIVDPRSHYAPRADDPEDAGSSEKNVEFERQLKRIFKGSLIYARTREDSPTVNIATMQRIELQRMRKELVKLAFQFKYLREGTSKMNEKLHAYGMYDCLVDSTFEALKDYDYMRERAARGELADPFIVTTKRGRDRFLMWQAEAEFQDGVSDSDDADFMEDAFEKDLKVAGKRPVGSGRPSLMLGDMETRNVVNAKDRIKGFLKRLGMECLGGAFLIGSMLLMVLTASQLASLIAPSVCVFVFGVAMAVFLDKPFDVLSATAAYAAVLVVFVGTSTSTTTAES
ncbi:hypothetical protein B0T14DRAFT_567207 [Immersiella caudata]|uniref:DUF6594 domain-containing protein n=1 Tax=Immersiella caudata TaxID=314043 RepID=A0AA40C0R4_9PEZI|nr:hypothetical protein B0T14DRAFT_567207 [Immersiella caudata]